MQKVAKTNYKIALIKFGISQRELADTLGYSEQYISMILAGKRNCRRFDEWLQKNIPSLFKRGARLRWTMKFGSLLKKSAL